MADPWLFGNPNLHAAHNNFNPNRYNPNNWGLRNQVKLYAGAFGLAAYGVGKAVEGAVNTVAHFGTPNTKKRLRFDSPATDKENTPDQPPAKRSFKNLPSTTEMEPSKEQEPMAEARIGGAAGIANSKGRETQVIPLPRHVAFGLPDFFTTKLRYRDFQNLQFTTNTAFNYAGKDIKLRVNSIYDVDYGLSGDQQPQWRDFYAAKYNYYTVIGCEYKIHFYNFNPVASANSWPTPWWICHRTYGDNVPNSFTLTHSDLLKDPHMKASYLPGDFNSVGTTTMSGYISHQDYKNNLQEVSQDGNDLIWTPINSDPTLTHDLYIMPRRITTGEIGEIVKYEIELNYTVQFRELKSDAQFNQEA